MGLLQVAAGLVKDDEDDKEAGDGGRADSKAKKKELEKKLKGKAGAGGAALSAAAPTATATDRGIKVLLYLCSKTSVKEEVAHGFRATPMLSRTVLERLVDLASRPYSPDGGASQSQSSAAAYGLASAFSVDTLRREAFEGKDITAEQYDELQNLGKTKEEKELAEREEEHDPPGAVGARIRRMGAAGVPRALVKLGESVRVVGGGGKGGGGKGGGGGGGSSSSSTDGGAAEMVVRAMCRMAMEESMRGAMVQQGCLSSCIKVEKGESKAEKKIVRTARHAVAKLLILTNPALLTSSQRLGSVPPLIALVRNSESSDLMQFEALMALTNLGSAGPDTKDRIVSERGVAALGYAMFSNHPLVRRAATEAVSNLAPHPKIMEHLFDPERMKLWVAFVSDFEENFECARAAAGCLAMATWNPAVALALCAAGRFGEMAKSLLECGT